MSAGSPHLEYTHVAPVGALDGAGLASLDRALIDAEAASRQIVLDLRGQSAIDASGIQLVLAADKRIRRGGGRLFVIAGPEEIHWRLAIARDPLKTCVPERRPRLDKLPAPKDRVRMDKDVVTDGQPFSEVLDTGQLEIGGASPSRR